MSGLDCPTGLGCTPSVMIRPAVAGTDLKRLAEPFALLRTGRPCLQVDPLPAGRDHQSGEAVRRADLGYGDPQRAFIIPTTLRMVVVALPRSIGSRSASVITATAPSNAGRV